MRTFDERLLGGARTQRQFGARVDAGSARSNEPPAADHLDESVVLNLQRLAGNAAVTSLLSGERAASSATPRPSEVGAPMPRLDVGAFGTDGRSILGAVGGQPDKSPEEKEGEFDQAPKDVKTDVGTFAQTNRGVRIVAEINGGFSSDEFPDGLKFTQVIETNKPLNGASSPYTDPHPNDDEKPFYWTDPEQERFPTTFKDHPKRNPPTGGEVTYWQATLALNGVNEETKSVVGFDYITYGFMVDAAGGIRLSYPQHVDGETHRQALSAEFSSWTFT
ncbi:MAG TPA: hypothetical protein VFV72_10045 [Candidatus Limnocylindrales bacterium]|nr:hypothetical protein [Candidatus Limnocylindrales bacterium]